MTLALLAVATHSSFGPLKFLGTIEVIFLELIRLKRPSF